MAGSTLDIDVWDQPDSGSSGEHFQAVVDLETKTVAEKTSRELLGGALVGGDDDWVLVEKSGLVNPGDPWGSFRMRPDGSGEEAVTESKLASDFDQANGTWAIETLGGLTDDKFYVSTYTAADGLKQIGCISGEDTTTHVFRAGKNAVYIAVDRDEKATIFKIPF